MYSSFLVAVGVVFPMAALMVLGAGVRVGGFIDRDTMTSFNRLLFKLFMPLLLFKNLYDLEDFSSLDPRITWMAVGGILVMLLVALTVPKLIEADRNKAASMGQAMVRTNYIIFALTVAESIYGSGNAGLVALLGVIVIPMTNALGVVVLELNRSGHAGIKKLIISILKNPMIVAAIAAMFFKILPISIPSLLYDVVKNVASATTTISFISLGVGLDLGMAVKNFRSIAFFVAIRMFALPIALLAISLLLGMRGIGLCAMMGIFASPTAVASYPMAVAMGADGPMAGQLVCVTTLMSVVTIFLGTFIFQSLGYF